MDELRTLSFLVPGDPVGKGRPIAGKSFAGHTTLRTPAKTVSYENLVGWTAAQAMAGRPLMQGPVRVDLNIEMTIPASWSQKKKDMAIRGEVRPTTKPDMDNVIKAAFDSMNGVVWNDDVQVVALSVRKHYSVRPSLQMCIERLDAKGSQ